jgi:ribosome biogenesis GTPase
MHDEGVVLTRAGGRYGVRTVAGADVEASLRGRMKQQDDDRVLVGDRVRLVDDGASVTIEEVLPRRSLLKRRRPGQARGTRAVAANLDQVIVVGAVDHPPWDPALMDRFVAVAEANDLPVVLVINKVDLPGRADAHAAPYRAAGYTIVFTSASTGDGVADLRERMAGKVSLFTGPTGVGKSSLGNAVVPGLDLRTGVVSERSRAGRHTTVTATMHPLPDGGFVVDTPGLRDIGLWGLTPPEVLSAFPEIAALAPGCKFDDCRHGAEPACAVLAAVQAGRLAASRHASFRRLLAEADEASRWWE